MSGEALFAIICLFLFVAWMASVAVDEYRRKDDD